MKNTIVILSLLAAFLLTDTRAYSKTPTPKEATLIVYRKGCLYGALAKYKVIVDHKKLAQLKNNKIREFVIAPGDHRISPKQSNRAIKFNAESGQTYVVAYKTRIGIFGARPRLKVMTVEQAEKSSKFFRDHKGQDMSM